MAPIGEWLDAVVADDATTSAEVDLGGIRDTLLLYVPTIDNATVSLTVAIAAGGTHAAPKLTNVDGTEEPILATASTGGYFWRIPFGYQYLKVVCGAAQTNGPRTFKVRGL